MYKWSLCEISEILPDADTSKKEDGAYVEKEEKKGMLQGEE
jgi:hypothetical protein